MPVMSCHTDFAHPERSYTDYVFSSETKVRPAGVVDDPADLDIAYDRAKQKVDEDAERQPTYASGEPTYEVYVRVVRTHRHTTQTEATS